MKKQSTIISFKQKKLQTSKWVGDHEGIQELDHESNYHLVLWKLIVIVKRDQKREKEKKKISYKYVNKVSEPNWVGIVPLNELSFEILFWFFKKSFKRKSSKKMKNYHSFKWESCPTWVGIVPDNELDPTSNKKSSESPSIWVGISPLKEFSFAILHSKK